MTSKLSAAFLAVVLLLAEGCANVTPTVSTPVSASFSGNDPHSGIIRFIAGGGLEIDASALARYNAYVDAYGKRLKPPIRRDFGCAPLLNGHWSMTCEAAEAWNTMELLEERDRIDRADSISKKVFGK